MILSHLLGGEIAHNGDIVVANPPTRFGMIDRAAQRRIAEEALARAGGEDIHPSALVKDLPLSRRQLVEIAKALARKPRVLHGGCRMGDPRANAVRVMAFFPQIGPRASRAAPSPARVRPTAMSLKWATTGP